MLQVPRAGSHSCGMSQPVISIVRQRSVKLLLGFGLALPGQMLEDSRQDVDLQATFCVDRQWAADRVQTARCTILALPRDSDLQFANHFPDV